MFDALRDRKTNKTETDAKASETDKAKVEEKTPNALADAGLNDDDLPPIEDTFAGVSQHFQTPDTSSHVSKPTVAEQIKQIRRNVDQSSDFSSFEAPEPEAPNRPDQKLTVGQGIQLKGEISNCDTLVVQGHIEATASTRCIEIADSGTFKGNAEIQMADISGHFEGDLAVADRLIIRSSGRVKGKIRYNSIEIEAGGEIAGDIQVTQEAQDAKKSEEAKKTAEAAKNGGKDAKDGLKDSKTEEPAPKTASAGGR